MLTRRGLIVAALAAGGVVAPLAMMRPVARAAQPVAKKTMASVDPRAIRLLTEMGAAYKSLDSYSGNEVAEGDPRMSLPYEMSLTFQRPGRIVADITRHYDTKGQRSHILLDGKALYVSSDGAPSKVSRITTPLKNYTLWEDAFMVREDIKFPLIVGLLEQSPDMVKALTQARPGTTISLGTPGVVDRIPVDTIIERSTHEGSVSVSTYQIGQADHLLRRITEDNQATTYQPASHISQTFLYVHANPTLPVYTFVFAAPPGVTVTDEHRPGADADPAAVALLTRMYAAYTALKSFSCNMTVSLHGPSYGPNGMTIATTPDVSRATYAIQKPYRAFITRTDSGGTAQAICDGTTLYVTLANTPTEASHLPIIALPGRYLKLPLQADPGNVAYNLSNFGGLGDFGGGQQDFVPQAVLGWEVRPADGGYNWKMGPAGEVNGEPVETVTLREDDQNDANYSIMTLAINPKDHLLRQVTMEYHDGGQPVQQEFDTFTNVQVNPSLPASLFVFTPPPGSHPVPLASDLVAKR